jgi:hypothetical protein
MAPERARSKVVVKVVVALVAVAALAYGFMGSARQSRSQAYVVPNAHLRPWTVSVEMATQPNEPILMLRPPSALSSDLFDQTFKRSMESMSAPETAGIPLVLQGELERAGSERISADDLLAIARHAGLETVPPQPRCLAHRRAPEPDTRQQLYFAIFQSQAFQAFRGELRQRLGEKFDPEFLTPILFVGVVESHLSRWLPIHVEGEKDCVAPIEVSMAAP